MRSRFPTENQDASEYTYAFRKLSRHNHTRSKYLVLYNILIQEKINEKFNTILVALLA